MASTASPFTLRLEGHQGRSLTLLLFMNITNIQDIRTHILESKEPEFAFLNAEAVSDAFPLHLAAHKSLTAQAKGTLVTKTVHTELVYNLSSTKHIGESLKRFGATEETKHLIAARFDATPEHVAFVQQLVKGDIEPLDRLKDTAKPDVICKYYKISQEELRIGSLGEAVACRIASRDC